MNSDHSKADGGIVNYRLTMIFILSALHLGLILPGSPNFMRAQG